MRITKLGHSCVRLEYDGNVVVLDPGMFTDADAVDGADAIVITHEHPDHYLPDHLRRTDAPVFTIAAVAAKIREDAPEVGERVTVVAPGESFDPGIPAEAVGELHAVIHPDIPRVGNVGVLVGTAISDGGSGLLLHPGDSYAQTPTVDVLALPLWAPWSKVAEMVDFLRAVSPTVAVPIHAYCPSRCG